MMQEYRKIGISGGTFDPIHHGHLITAEYIREKFKLEKVLFVPSGTPPHKAGRNVADAEHRYRMVYEAIEGNPGFEASRIEVERAGYTYTVDTLRQLKHIYGEKTTLYFIIGADVVNDLLLWREPKTVFGLCEFIAVLRPGYDRDMFLAQVNELKNNYGAVIHEENVPLIDISSTAIRDRIGNRMSVKYLVPAIVEEYIKNNKLYTGDL